MEKASTPSNRRTRSSRKQGSTPKKVDQEEGMDSSPAEDVKCSMRKLRRKADTKPKTNGDTTVNVDGKKLHSIEEIHDGNSLDGCDSEGSSMVGSVGSPKSSTVKTSPAISRKSLRARRSVTPGPELDSSTCKRLKRSTSESKLESVSTPKRRSTRAQSESKDFVFTPSKTKTPKIDTEKVNSASEYASKNYNPRVIDRIVETNEEEPVANELEGSNDVQKASEKLTEVNSSPKGKSETDDDQTKLNESSVPDDKPSSLCSSEASSDNRNDKEEPDKSTSTTLSRIEEDPKTSVDCVQVTSEACNDVEDICSDNSGAVCNDNRDDKEEDEKSSLTTLPVIEDQAPKMFSDGVQTTSGVCNDAEDLSNVHTEDVFSDNRDGKDENEEIGPPTFSSVVEHKDSEQSSDDMQTCENSEENEKNDIPNNVSEEITQDTATFDAQGLPPNDEITISDEDDTGNAVASTDCLVISDVQSLKPQDSDKNKTLKDESNQIHLLESNLSSDNNNVKTEEVQIGNNSTTLLENMVVEEHEEIEKIQSSEVVKNKHSEDLLNDNKAVSSNNTGEEAEETPTEEEITEEPLTLCESYQPEQCNMTNIPEVIKETTKKSDFLNNGKSSHNLKKIISEDFILPDKYDETYDQHVDYKNDLNEDVDPDLISSPQYNQCLDDEVVIEDSDNNQNDECRALIEEVKTSENPYNIQVFDPNIIAEVEDSEFVEDIPLQNAETKDSFKDEQVKSEINEAAEEVCNLEVSDQDDEEIAYDKIEESEKQPDETARDSKLKLDEHCHPQSEEGYIDENFDGRTSNKEDDDSASDSEIYKGMSDFGTDRDEKLEGSPFDDSVSSDVGTGCDSEEYVSSGDHDELDEEQNINQENVPSNDQLCKNNQKLDQGNDTKAGAKLFDRDSPITYDKALAMINKDREKKIDDEEFFDMFTEELNRVSEASGSDSDIAIIDEYVMEPEEPPKKPNPKVAKQPVNTKPPAQRIGQRMPAPGPRLPNHPVPQGDNFASTFNQPGPNRHHPGMVRVNFPQGGIYHQFNQGMPPVNVIRGPIVFDQFCQTPANMPDPRIYNPHAPDPNFHPDMFNPMEHMRPCDDQVMHYSSGPSIKVRNINSMNRPQSSNMTNSFVGPEQAVALYSSDLNTCKNISENEDNFSKNVVVSTGTMTEGDKKVFHESSYSSASIDTSKLSSPILDLLGLNKEKLKLLKQVLGIDKQTRDTRKNEENHRKAQHLKILNRSANINKDKKKRHRVVSAVARQRAVKKAMVKQILESDSTCYERFKESCSDPSESSATGSVCTFPGPFKTNRRTQETSSDLSVESEDREITLEDDNVSVTINTRPKRLRPKRKFQRVQSSEDSDSESFQRKSKSKGSSKKFKVNSSCGGVSRKRKMTRGKNPIQKKTTTLKSNCGTFTVDALTTPSQTSDSEATSQSETATGSVKFLEELRSMKSGLARGRNKLSNLFTQHSSGQAKKTSKRKIKDAFEEIEKPVGKVRKMKKLSSDILEKLSKEGIHLTDSGSAEDVVENPRKKRKRALKLKVKSAAGEQTYIPCVSSGATKFSLSRLDKDSSLTAAQLAAKFRNDQLYGASVKRITNKELINIKKKQKRGQSAAKKNKIVLKDEKESE